MRYFQLALEKYFGLLNIASWLATNPFEQGSVTDVASSLFIECFCLELQAFYFAAFTDMNST